MKRTHTDRAERPRQCGFGGHNYFKDKQLHNPCAAAGGACCHLLTRCLCCKAAGGSPLWVCLRCWEEIAATIKDYLKKKEGTHQPIEHPVLDALLTTDWRALRDQAIAAHDSQTRQVRPAGSCRPRPAPLTSARWLISTVSGRACLPSDSRDSRRSRACARMAPTGRGSTGPIAALLTTTLSSPRPPRPRRMRARPRSCSTAFRKRLGAQRCRCSTTTASSSSGRCATASAPPPARRARAHRRVTCSDFLHHQVVLCVYVLRSVLTQEQESACEGRLVRRSS